MASSIALGAMLLASSATAFSASATTNLAVYWGQNSGGSQGTLATYCQDSTIDIIPLAFLTAFGTGSYNLNFANMCSGATLADSTLIECDQIAADIKTCQAAGKKILLSMGGASGSYGFSSSAQAVQVANDMWNYFGGGSSSIRPFGTSIVDGFDLDIENNDPAYYPDFIAQLRTLYASQSAKTYYISGAPQCVYPDASLKDALADSYFDFLFIQFYNNWCGVYQYGSISGAFNYDVWDTWAKSTSQNPNVKLYLGVAAATGAANSGTGYVAPSLMIEAAQGLQAQYPTSFGGVMMWDASQAYANIPSGYTINYAQIAKQALGGTISSVASTSSTVQASTTSANPGNVAAPTTTTTSNLPTPTTSTSTSGAAATTTAAGRLPLTVASGCTSYYTVVSGDYCYAIWTKYGLSSTQFYSLNPTLSAANDCAIVPGQVLCVAGTATVAASTVSTTTTTITSTSTTTTRISTTSHSTSTTVPGRVALTVSSTASTTAASREPLVAKVVSTTSKTSATASSTALAGICPVAGDSCAVGSYQCNGYGYAQCVFGVWVLRDCPTGTACAGSGSNIYCDTPGTATVTCAGITGKTSSKRSLSDEDEAELEVETTMNTHRLNDTHFAVTLRAAATGIVPITDDWFFTFESDKDILESDRGILYRDAVHGTYTISADPLAVNKPTRKLIVRLVGTYEKHKVVVQRKNWMW